MDLAKEMTKEALPIKCLEAVILGMYPSSALGGLGGAGARSAPLGPASSSGRGGLSGPQGPPGWARSPSSHELGSKGKVLEGGLSPPGLSC